MGFLRNIRGIFNTKLMGEEIVDRQLRAYERYKRFGPHLEDHELLAKVWLSRQKAREQYMSQKTDDHTLNLLAFTETHLFSVLDYPKSIRALGLYTVYKERLDIIEQHPEFAEEYGELVEPALRARLEGTFMEWYKRKNPKLAAQMAE